MPYAVAVYTGLHCRGGGGGDANCDILVILSQGAHYRGKSGKTGNLVKIFEKSGNMEKMGKSGNSTKTCEGNIRDYSTGLMI